MDVVNACPKEPAHGGDPASSPRLRREPAAGGPIRTWREPLLPARGQPM